MEDTTPQFRWRSSNPINGTDEVVHQVLDIIGTAVGEVALGQRPHSFIGIEFRRVGRKVFDAETGVLPQQFLQRFPVMGAGVVQQGDHRPLQMAQQVTEEHADFLLADVLVVQLVEQAQTLSFRADRDPRDHGNLVAPVAVVDHRRLTPRRPGLGYMGDQQESGFVGKDDVGAQPSGVFFTRGQSFFFQRAMVFSSRSTARVSGF